MEGVEGHGGSCGSGNGCLAFVLDTLSLFIICCTSALLSGEYGSGLKTGALGVGSGVVSSHASRGVRNG